MKRRTDEEISAPLYAYDADIRAQYGCFAGVDEAGRGPLCGPVCVAACILDPEAPVYGINDSKKLSEKKREALFDQIVEKALAYKIVFVGPDIIDRDNILNATMSGMRQAVEGLDIVPNLVLVDGNRIPAGLTMPAQPVVKGDATSASIGAASILAKVSRDRYMLELDKQYPQYLRETGRGPHHPQLSHPDGGDRPHPAGIGRNAGVLRGKDPRQRLSGYPRCGGQRRQAAPYHRIRRMVSPKHPSERRAGAFRRGRSRPS